jgi:3,4-dihydroxy 2-butanone 4-phosphate synthase/GTP cyclohydrolase II
MRAGHTEAGCDLARMAGLRPAAVICEIMNEDGTMARVPQLREFCAQHGLKLGTIADLIRHRSQHDQLVDNAGERALDTPQGRFQARTYRDRFGGAHLALTLGEWTDQEPVMVRVHEPVSALDLLDTGDNGHSWPLPRALAAIQAEGRGAVLLLNGGETADAFADAALGQRQPRVFNPDAADTEWRTYGIGAQILRDLGIGKMTVLGHPTRFPSMGGYGLSAERFVAPEDLG